MYSASLERLRKADTIEHLGSDVRRIGQGCRGYPVARYGTWRLDPLRKHGRVYTARCVAVQWIPGAQSACCC